MLNENHRTSEDPATDRKRCSTSQLWIIFTICLQNNYKQFNLQHTWKSGSKAFFGSLLFTSHAVL